MKNLYIICCVFVSGLVFAEEKSFHLKDRDATYGIVPIVSLDGGDKNDYLTLKISALMESFLLEEGVKIVAYDLRDYALEEIERSQSGLTERALSIGQQANIEKIFYGYYVFRTESVIEVFISLVDVESTLLEKKINFAIPVTDIESDFILYFTGKKTYDVKKVPNGLRKDAKSKKGSSVDVSVNKTAATTLIVLGFAGIIAAILGSFVVNGN